MICAVACRSCCTAHGVRASRSESELGESRGNNRSHALSLPSSFLASGDASYATIALRRMIHRPIDRKRATSSFVSCEKHHLDRIANIEAAASENLSSALRHAPIFFCECVCSSKSRHRLGLDRIRLASRPCRCCLRRAMLVWQLQPCEKTVAVFSLARFSGVAPHAAQRDGSKNSRRVAQTGLPLRSRR
jgi:hypothetical protein